MTIPHAPSEPATPSVAPTQVHTSRLLRDVIDSAPDGYFTLDWLMGSLPKNSFGVIMLILALLTALPGISVVSSALLIILAGQIILGYRAPVLPRSLMLRRLPSRYLVRLDRHAIPALVKLETIVRPRWPLVLIGIARQVTAAIAIMLLLIALLAPVPLLNLLPALVCSLLALAHIEHDGMLLVFALVAALASLAVIPLFVL